MNLRALQGLAATLQGKSDMVISARLREQGLSPEESITVKHMLMAATVQKRSNEIRAAAGEAPGRRTLRSDS